MENLITYSKTSPISDEKFDRLFEILEYSFPPCERGNYKNIANYNIFYIFVTINNITNRHANKPTV